MTAEFVPFPPRLRPTTRGGTLAQLLALSAGALALPLVTFRQLSRSTLPGGPTATFLILSSAAALLWIGLRRDQLAGRAPGAPASTLLAPLLLPFLIGLLGSLHGMTRTIEALDDLFEPLGSRQWARIALQGSDETLQPGMMGALISGYLLLAVVVLASLRSRLAPHAPRTKARPPLATLALFGLPPLGFLLRAGSGAEPLPLDLLLTLAVIAGSLLARRAARHEAGGLLEAPLEIVRRALPLGAALLAFAAFELVRGHGLGMQTGESIDPEQGVRLARSLLEDTQRRAALGLVETAAIAVLIGSAIGPRPAPGEGPRSWRLAGALGLALALHLGVEWQIRGVLADARALSVRFHEQPELVLPLMPRFGEEMIRLPVVYVPRVGDLRYDASHGKQRPELFGDAPLERLAQHLDTLGAVGAGRPAALVIAADREAPLGTIRAVASAATRIDPGTGIFLAARTSPLGPEGCPEESCAPALATVQAVALAFQRPSRRPTHNQLRLGEDGQIEGEAPRGRPVTLMVSEQTRSGQLLAALAHLAARGLGPVEVAVEGEAVARAPE